jgi:prepilin-type processing-associated H-X9-DG protein
MKQLGLGLIQYAQDYDETYPPRNGACCGSSAYWDYQNGYERVWPNEVYPYVKNWDVWKCPSNYAANVYGDWVDSINGPAQEPYFKLGYEAYLLNITSGSGYGGVFPNGWSYPYTEASLTYPAQELIIVEGSYDFADTGTYLAYCEPSPSPTDPNCPTSATTEFLPAPSSTFSGHAKKACNIVYLDGHAKYRNLRDTYKSDPGRNDENDWRISYNYCEYTDPGDWKWFNTTPDTMDNYPNDSGSF